MRVLVGCECSGKVRDAFRKKGHDAYSCDMKPAEDGSPYHIQGDLLKQLDKGWDLMIAHPPCTHLAVSGARWFKDKKEQQKEGLEFVKKLMDAPIPKIAIENPVSVISSKIRKADQMISPHEFGHPEAKRTCLWLKGLPKLKSTKYVEPEYITYASGKRMPKWYAEAWSLPKEERSTLRSRTFEGIANAMADQWGKDNLIVEVPLKTRKTKIHKPISKTQLKLAGMQ